MQITTVKISRSVVAWGAAFDISVTVKMGANEYIRASNDDYIMFDIYPPASLRKSEGEYQDAKLSPDDPAYEYEIMGYDSEAEFRVGEYRGVAISKGASKTFKLTGVRLDADSCNWTHPNHYYQVLADDGAARAYALTLEAYASNMATFAGYTARKTNAMTLLLSHQAPTISSVTVTDTREITNPLTGATGNPLDVFGRLVDGQSLPHVVVEHALDPLDPSLTAEVTLEVYGYMPPIIIMGQVVEPERYELRETLTSATGVFDLGAILLQTAELALRCRVTDSAGSVSSTAEWRQPIYVYSGPTLEDFAALRYKESLDSGSVQYVQAVDGPYMMVNLRAGADSVNGLNACRLQIGYREYGTDNWTMADVLTGADGMAAQYTEDRTIFGLHVFSPATTYEVVAVLTDCFGSTRLLSDLVLKAAAIFNVEKTGVAVGMRSTGTEANPLFQCAYPAVFSGNVTVPAEGLLKAVPVTVASAQSVSASSTANYTAAVGAGDDWTPIGVVGYNYNSRYMTLLRAYINSDGEAACTIYNADSSARAVTIIMYVLCLRTG